MDPAMRITTITGPVGIGKSRLAAAVFHDVSGRFANGARFLELESDCSGDALRRALGSAVRPSPEAPGAHRPVDRRFLLALDCYADVPADLPGRLTEILAADAGVAVLVAAPESLGVYGEEVLRLAPLPVPGRADALTVAELEEVASVRLFLRRVRATRPDFALTPANREAVGRLCARTDGVPLAIELAAARTKLHSPQSILDRLEENLDVLSGKGGETLSRHTGMRDAIGWSVARLHPDDVELLGWAATFLDGIDLPAARVLADASAEEVQGQLERLVDRNLLQAGDDGNGGVVFRLSGLTRQYVRESLRDNGGLTRMRRAHAEFCRSVADSVRDPDSGVEAQHPTTRRWLPDLEEAASFLLGDAAPAGAIRLATAVHPYWQGALGLRGAVCLLTEALCADTLPSGLANEGNVVLGELLTWTGEFEPADVRLRRAYRGFTADGDSGGAAIALARMGRLAFHRGDVETAERLLQTAAADLDSSGAECERASALRGLADCRLARGDHRAMCAARTALHEAVRLRDSREAALAGCVLADTLLAAGEPREAERHHRSSLQMLRDLGDRTGCATALERFAVHWIRLRDPGDDARRRAVRVTGAASALRESLGSVAPAPLADTRTTALDRVRTQLGEHTYHESWSAGRALDLDAAVADALAPTGDATARTRRRRVSHPLTERELQVAELVSQGMTNREVARRLGISEWTAINHLRKVMRKLDCSSRVHVAGWFTELGRGGEAVDA